MFLPILSTPTNQYAVAFRQCVLDHRGTLEELLTLDDSVLLTDLREEVQVRFMEFIDQVRRTFTPD